MKSKVTGEAREFKDKNVHETGSGIPGPSSQVPLQSNTGTPLTIM